MWLQHLAQGAGGQGDEDQLAIGQGALQVGDRLDPGMHLDPFQVARVLASAADRLGLLRVAHPLADRLAVLGQQVGDGGAETAAAEHGNRLLLCHDSSISGRHAAIRHYTVGQPADQS